MTSGSLAVRRVGFRPIKPVLVYDGDCDFCRRWIRRWQQIAGSGMECLPFQDPQIAQWFPEIPATQFEASVQWIERDGSVYSGAEAAFRAISPAMPWPLRLYRHTPGFAKVAESAYGLVASRRRLFSRLTAWCWGDNLEAPSHSLVRAWFLRSLGIVYLAAFASLGAQVAGLVGRQGILPATDYLQAVQEYADREHVGVGRYLQVPTLCWLESDDAFLRGQCFAGIVLSLVLIVGALPGPCLLLLWLLYLSLTSVGGIFLGYQWDNLLLETGLLAILFAPTTAWLQSPRARPPSIAVLWLIRWLLFRLMFSSGCVKLLSGDPTWLHLTALHYHYETQPLPTWIAWYLAQCPDWFHTLSTAVMFFIELVIPFLIFFPRRIRFLAFWPFLGLQLLIALAGNYTYFNMLTAVLCWVLLDDRALIALLPRRRARGVDRFEANASSVSDRIAPRLLGWGRNGCAAALFILSLVPMAGMIRSIHLVPGPLLALYQRTQPFRSVNGYGLFAVMTTSRPEIILEGSRDGVNWTPYPFRYKPGELDRRPGFVAPHQPRLDWQMWFAALSDLRQNPWFLGLMRRLLEGSPPVVRLFREDPFPEGPPRYARAVLYDYHFTDASTRRASGNWWRRDNARIYCPPISLESFRNGR